MRLIIQRVRKASVKVEGKVYNSIENGLLVLVGIGKDDKEEDIEFCCRKLMNCKLWPDDNGKQWKKSVVAKQYELLIISQFTLYGSLKKSSPDFHLSMAADEAIKYYKNYLSALRKNYNVIDKIKEGSFGEHMEVELINDGPVTLIVDSSEIKKN